MNDVKRASQIQCAVCTEEMYAQVVAGISSDPLLLPPPNLPGFSRKRLGWGRQEKGPY